MNTSCPLKKYQNYIDWIQTQDDAILSRLKTWVNINSGSYHVQGIERQLSELQTLLEKLGAVTEKISLDPTFTINHRGQKTPRELGPCLKAELRPDSKTKVLLNGHLDTVFGKDSPFQHVTESSKTQWIGPGIIDLKGGLVILTTALEAFERSPFKDKLGFTLFFNSDEEIGSPGSSPYLTSLAPSCTVGLIFEPSYSDGAFVSARKGSLNFTVTSRGKASHVGRNFQDGKSALLPLAHFAIEAHKLNQEDLTLNIGKIEGGGPVNIVPDLGLIRCNLRAPDQDKITKAREALQAIVDQLNKAGADMQLHTTGYRPPKPFDSKTQKLFQAIKSCGESLDQYIHWRPSGGVADGNTLAQAGLPTIDTLGAIGGGMHTHEEYVILDSLTKRAQLTTLFLLRLANGEFPNLTTENTA